MSEKVYLSVYAPVMPINPGKSENNHSESGKAGKRDQFGTLFNQELQKQSQIKISAHAEKRLQQRNINLDAEKIASIEKAVEKAQAKGARESLILMNDLAFVVSVPNKTIITAMDQASMKNNVFTNIDSAVII